MSALTGRFMNVFHWPVAHPIRLLLPGMVVVSLVVHLLAAYVVKTGIPARPALAPWPSKLTLFPMAGGQGVMLLEARDPSWLEPGRYRGRLLPPLAVRPLFEQRAPRPAPPALAPAGARFESGAAWVSEDALNRIRSVAPPEPPGRATELLVVLAPSGDVRHVWLVRGCGDAELDFAAQRAVQRSRFAPAAGPRRDVLRVTWGPREPAP